MNKTVFILAGGNDRESEDYGQRLWSEISKYNSNPKVLSCFFSSPEETWKQKAQDWENWFINGFGRSIAYDYAQYATFLDQVDSADVIYLHGGDTKLLFDALPDAEELKKHFAGKVVIGSSAGANVLSHYFWSSTRGVLGRGKGIVDVNIMVHYGAPDAGDYKRTPQDWKREEGELERIGKKAVTHLPEGQFIIVTI